MNAVIHRVHQRAANRVRDVLAVLAGYCNDSPWRPDPGKGGGYSFWRCARPRGHYGLHRSRNYAWNDEGQTVYSPIEPCPSQPQDRFPILRLRQQRQVDRWHGQQRAKRRQERSAS